MLCLIFKKFVLLLDFVDENVFLDVPPEFELFTNIKKIIVKEFIGIYFLIIYNIQIF
jgi:hypothetical protein